MYTREDFGPNPAFSPFTDSPPSSPPSPHSMLAARRRPAIIDLASSSTTTASDSGGGSAPNQYSTQQYTDPRSLFTGHSTSEISIRPAHRQQAQALHMDGPSLPSSTGHSQPSSQPGQHNNGSANAQARFFASESIAAAQPQSASTAIHAPPMHNPPPQLSADSAQPQPPLQRHPRPQPQAQPQQALPQTQILMHPFVTTQNHAPQRTMPHARLNNRGAFLGPHSGAAALATSTPGASTSTSTSSSINPYYHTASNGTAASSPSSVPYAMPLGGASVYSRVHPLTQSSVPTASSGVSLSQAPAPNSGARAAPLFNSSTPGASGSGASIVVQAYPSHTSTSAFTSATASSASPLPPTGSNNNNATDDAVQYLPSTSLPISTTAITPHTRVLVDEIPIPHHHLYYPRSAWGPPPTRKVLEERRAARKAGRAMADWALPTKWKNWRVGLVPAATGADAGGGGVGGEDKVGKGIKGTRRPPGVKKRKAAALPDTADAAPSPSSPSSPLNIFQTTEQEEYEVTNPTSGDLDDLADGHDPSARPPYPIQTMIKFVLMGSPRGKLSLSEVYEVVTARFPFYVPKPVDSNRPDWQNNVRHSLSTFVCFVQEEREIDDPGKGQYWTYVPGYGDLTRKKPRTKAAREQRAQEEREKEEAEAAAGDDGAPKKRPRGRPKGSGTKNKPSATPDVMQVSPHNPAPLAAVPMSASPSTATMHSTPTSAFAPTTLPGLSSTSSSSSPHPFVTAPSGTAQGADDMALRSSGSGSGGSGVVAATSGGDATATSLRLGRLSPVVPAPARPDSAPFLSPSIASRASMEPTSSVPAVPLDMSSSSNDLDLTALTESDKALLERDPEFAELIRLRQQRARLQEARAREEAKVEEMKRHEKMAELQMLQAEKAARERVARQKVAVASSATVSAAQQLDTAPLADEDDEDDEEGAREEEVPDVESEDDVQIIDRPADWNRRLATSPSSAAAQLPNVLGTSSRPLRAASRAASLSIASIDDLDPEASPTPNPSTSTSHLPGPSVPGTILAQRKPRARRNHATLLQAKRVPENYMNPSEIAARTNANRYLPVQRVPDPQEMADLKRAKVAWEQTQGMLGLGLAAPPPVLTTAAPIGGVGTLPVTAAVVWPANHPRHPVPGHEPVDGRPVKTNKPFVPVQGTRLAAQMKEKEMTANDDVSGSDEDDSRMRHSHGTLSRIPPAATEGEPVSAAPLASVPPPIEEDPSGPSLLADQPFEPSTASPALIAARPTTASEVLSFSPQPVAHSPATHPSITSPHPHSTPPMAVVVPTPHPVSSLPSPTAPQSMDPPIPLNPTSAIAPTVTPEGLKKQPKRKPKPNPSGGKKSPSRPPASSTSPATNSAGANPPLLAPSAPTVTPTPTSRVASGSGSGGKKRPRSEVDGEPDPSRASPHLPSTRRMAVVEMSQPASHLAASTSASAPSTVPASASNPILALPPIPPSSIAGFHVPPMTTGEAEVPPSTAAHATASALSHTPIDVHSIQHQTPMQLAAPHLSEPQMFSFHPDPQLADDATFWASQSMSMNQHALNIDSFTAQSQHPSSTLPPAFSQPFPSQPDPSSAVLSSASSSQHAVFGSSQSVELITSRHHTPSSSLHSYSDPSPSSSQSSQSQQQSLSQHHSATASKPRHPLATHPALNDGRPPEMSNPAIMKAFIAEHGALAKAKGGKPGKARFEVKPADFKVWWETKVAAGFTAAHFSNPSAMETGTVSTTASNAVDSHDAERQRARQLKEQRRLEREKQLRLFEQQQRELEAELLQPQNPYHAMGRGEGGSGSGSGGGAAGIGPAYFPS